MKKTVKLFFRIIHSEKRVPIDTAVCMHFVTSAITNYGGLHLLEKVISVEPGDRWFSVEVEKGKNENEVIASMFFLQKIDAMPVFVVRCENPFA